MQGIPLTHGRDLNAKRGPNKHQIDIVKEYLITSFPKMIFMLLIISVETLIMQNILGVIPSAKVCENSHVIYHFVM